MKFETVHKLFVVLTSFLLSTCGETDGEARSVYYCDPPTGSLISSDNRYITGAVTVNLGNSQTGDIQLYVQRRRKDSGGSWTNSTLGRFSSTGNTPCQTFTEMSALWQELFEDMNNSQIHVDAINAFVDGIRVTESDPNRASPGVYGESDLSACGYSGFTGTITCVPAATTGVKQYYMAHEITHSYQWSKVAPDIPGENIILYRVFANYANAFYTQAQSDSSVFDDEQGRWTVTSLDYALQNEAEWIAEIFPNFLYGGTGHWSYIQGNISTAVSFFNCLWLEGKSFSTCQSESSSGVVSFAQSVPVVDIPTYSGLSAAESEAIWRVCFDMSDKESYYATFNSAISRLTNGTYTDAASSYRLGYGDCNHDGFVDWVCTYEGLAPDGSAYLWNTSNQTGAVTFTATGKSSDSYAEYLQDPYDSTLGTLLKPLYREWQGSFGSCNGSRVFSSVPTWFPYFADEVSNLPSELSGKVDW